MHDAPELYTADLDLAKLDELLTDIEALGAFVEVTLKPRKLERADGAARPTLAEARRLLVENAVAGVQIRYQHAGQRWVDTLLPSPGATRLVRLRG